MRNTTLCYLMKEGEILLGMKKRGFGEGKWNGYGGKQEEGESVEESAIREIKEELGVNISLEDLKKSAEIDFFFKDKSDWNQKVYVFFINKWEGELVETEEMKPKWFSVEDFPLDKMWLDDPHWLPHAIKGEKIKAQFTFTQDGGEILDKNVNFIESFD